MGQKVHPFGFRVGITEAHKSRWYAPKALFAELLVEDYRIRQYVDKRLNRTPPFAAVADIHIERTREELKIILKTARPGLVIGPKGAEIEKLTSRSAGPDRPEGPDADHRDPHPGYQRPPGCRGDCGADEESVPTSVACSSSVAKQRCRPVPRACGFPSQGRLGGAEMSRTFVTRLGSIPLSTLQANVDYACVPSHTTYGTIGVRVWIYKGMYTGQDEDELESKAAGGRARARGRH